MIGVRDRLRRLGGREGQASVEVVALVPLVVLVAAAAFTVVSAGQASDAASAAAAAGAVALLQGRDAEAAARASLRSGGATAAGIRVRGGRVRVTVRPRTLLPGLGQRLDASSSADAGPRIAVVPPPLRGGDGAGSRPGRP